MFEVGQYIRAKREIPAKDIYSCKTVLPVGRLVRVEGYTSKTKQRAQLRPHGNAISIFATDLTEDNFELVTNLPKITLGTVVHEDRGYGKIIPRVVTAVERATILLTTLAARRYGEKAEVTDLNYETLILSNDEPNGRYKIVPGIKAKIKEPKNPLEEILTTDQIKALKAAGFSILEREPTAEDIIGADTVKRLYDAGWKIESREDSMRSYLLEGPMHHHRHRTFILG